MRHLLSLAILATGATLADGQIDRETLVRRHNVILRTADPWAPLSVGNGEFAFTADVTGLQSFPDHYRRSIPLAIQTQWGWHSFPNPEGFRLEDTFEVYDTAGRPVAYPTITRTPAGQWLRQNPHRLSLARIGLDFTLDSNPPVTLGDIHEITQRLDLWTGTIESSFSVRGESLRVRTWAHPHIDMIAVRIERDSNFSHPLGVRIEFPYGSGVAVGEPADWNQPAKHRTIPTSRSSRHVQWRRELDRDKYFVRLEWSPDAQLIKRSQHHYSLRFSASSFDFAAAFSSQPINNRLPDTTQTAAASRQHWKRFWSDGGAIDLSGSAHPRATELERRIILSQYLTAIQCAGSMPPQETGLTFNSWYGKFHLEMHWWHAAHFALWGRPHLLERSLPWYRSILPEARRTAQRQGYSGARWPKMVGPDGRESPSAIGPLLIWQQPHLIHLLELLYRARSDKRLLDQYSPLVFQTADFMASYPTWDERRRRFVLGPPLIPAQEIHPSRTTQNPTFELAYWRWGLETAQTWRQRMGLPRRPEWDHVLRHLATLPVVDGIYVNAESDPVTFTNPAKRRDHPTLLAAMGILPGGAADRDTMRRTLRKVMDSWQWEHTWGWDYPMTAMTAARVGEPELAIDALLMDTPKNRYLANGHNYQRQGLTIYLPGNGGLLTAVAMMAAGWDGAPKRPAPGFPQNGRWVVRYDGLLPLP